MEASNPRNDLVDTELPEANSERDAHQRSEVCSNEDRRQSTICKEALGILKRDPCARAEDEPASKRCRNEPQAVEANGDSVGGNDTMPTGFDVSACGRRLDIKRHCEADGDNDSRKRQRLATESESTAESSEALDRSPLPSAESQRIDAQQRVPLMAIPLTRRSESLWAANASASKRQLSLYYLVEAGTELAWSFETSPAISEDSWKVTASVAHVIEKVKIASWQRADLQMLEGRLLSGFEHRPFLVLHRKQHSYGNPTDRNSQALVVRFDIELMFDPDESPETVLTYEVASMAIGSGCKVAVPLGHREMLEVELVPCERQVCKDGVTYRRH